MAEIPRGIGSAVARIGVAGKPVAAVAAAGVEAKAAISAIKPPEISAVTPKIDFANKAESFLSNPKVGIKEIAATPIVPEITKSIPNESATPLPKTDVSKPIDNLGIRTNTTNLAGEVSAGQQSHATNPDGIIPPRESAKTEQGQGNLGINTANQNLSEQVQNRQQPENNAVQKPSETNPNTAQPKVEPQSTTQKPIETTTDKSNSENNQQKTRLQELQDKKAGDLTDTELDEMKKLKTETKGKNETAVEKKTLTPQEQIKKGMDDVAERVKKNGKFEQEDIKKLIELRNKSIDEFTKAITEKANKSLIEAIANPDNLRKNKELMASKEMQADIQKLIGLQLEEQSIPRQLEQIKHEVKEKKRMVKEQEHMIKSMKDGSDQKQQEILKLNTQYLELNGYLDYVAQLKVAHLKNGSQQAALSAKIRHGLGLANWLTTLKDLAGAGIQSQFANVSAELQGFADRGGYFRDAQAV